MGRSWRGVGLGLAAVVMATGCIGEGDPQDTHGVVKLIFDRSDDQAGSPYPSTATIEITLDYLECLIDFYTANPDYEQDGPLGAPIFGPASEGGEGWEDRLCADYTAAGDVPCEVVSIVQELDESKHLTVRYAVMGDQIEGREIRFGPLPNAELAACEGGADPIVRVGDSGAIRGLDGSGNTVWNTKSFNPDKAGTDQGQAIEIRAGLP